MTHRDRYSDAMVEVTLAVIDETMALAGLGREGMRPVAQAMLRVMSDELDEPQPDRGRLDARLRVIGREVIIQQAGPDAALAGFDPETGAVWR